MSFYISNIVFITKYIVNAGMIQRPLENSGNNSKKENRIGLDRY